MFNFRHCQGQWEAWLFFWDWHDEEGVWGAQSSCGGDAGLCHSPGASLSRHRVCHVRRPPLLPQNQQEDGKVFKVPESIINGLKHFQTHLKFERWLWSQSRCNIKSISDTFITPSISLRSQTNTAIEWLTSYWSVTSLLAIQCFQSHATKELLTILALANGCWLQNGCNRQTHTYTDNWLYCNPLRVNKYLLLQ